MMRATVVLLRAREWGPAQAQVRLLADRTIVLQAVARRPKIATRYLDAGVKPDGTVIRLQQNDALNEVMQKWRDTWGERADQLRQAVIRDHSYASASGIHPSASVPLMHHRIESGDNVLLATVIKSLGGHVASGAFAIREVTTTEASYQCSAAALRFAAIYLGIDIEGMIKAEVQQAYDEGLLPPP